MPSDKDRLYVMLYARGGKATMPGKEDTYHWALMVGPKIETGQKSGVRYHAKEEIKNGKSSWIFDERVSTLGPTNMLLVRVIVGKVEDGKRLVEILRNTPVRQGQTGWNCISWVKEALEMLKVDPKALGTSVVEWDKVRNAAMDYCQRKKDEHRFDGQVQYDFKKVPTYDLMEGKEITV